MSVTDVTATAPVTSTGGTTPNIALNTVPISSGGTGTTSLSASPFAVLSPSAQQTGSINVSANINAGGDITASGYFGSPNTNGVLGIFNVKDYGATGNGSTDDSSAILDAIAAANAVSVSGFPATVYFSPGIYYYDSSSVMQIYNGVTVFATSAAVTGGTSTTDAFYFYDASAGPSSPAADVMPNIFGFKSGHAIRIKQSGRNIFFSEINGCLYGVTLDCEGAAILDCTVRGFQIQGITEGTNAGLSKGVSVFSNSGSDQLQGHVVNINFVNGCIYGLYYHNTSDTAITPGVSFNSYGLHSIDANGLANSVGLYADSTFAVSSDKITCDLYFGSLRHSVHGTRVVLGFHFGTWLCSR